MYLGTNITFVNLNCFVIIPFLKALKYKTFPKNQTSPHVTLIYLESLLSAHRLHPYSPTPFTVHLI